MKLLVLGGSVFLSRAVAGEAVRRGHEVTCANRGVSGTVPAGARFVRFDRTGDVPRALHGFDAVVDVGRHPSRVRQAVAALPEAHWVFVSTISVYADPSTPGAATASATLEPRFEDVDLGEDPSAYGAMKVACEQVVRTGAASASIVRPGLIVGPDDPTGRFTYWPARLARTDSPAVLAPGALTDVVQVIDVRDLAAWLVDLAERRHAGTFDAIAPSLGIGSLLKQVAAGCDASPEFVWVPQDFLQAQGVVPWSGPRSVPLWLPRPEYDGMCDHDATPALEAGLAIRPHTETARDTLGWVRKDPAAVSTGLTTAEEAEVLRAWASESSYGRG